MEHLLCQCEQDSCASPGVNTVFSWVLKDPQCSAPIILVLAPKYGLGEDSSVGTVCPGHYGCPGALHCVSCVPGLV